MTVSIPNIPDIHNVGPLTHGFFEDFDEYVADDRWQLVADVGGVQEVIDAVGGQLSIKCDGDDNDEAYIFTKHQLHLFAANKPLLLMASIKFTEAATDDANILVGLMDAAAANALLDDGGGPAASYDGAVFYKVDGGTKWSVESSNAGDQVTDDTEESAGGGSFETLAILVTPLNSASAEVTYWIDRNGGVDLHQVRANGANPRTPSIKQTIALSGLEEMNVIFGVKAGGANEETLLVDYVSVWQKR